jgi:hypothetical protein
MRFNRDIDDIFSRHRIIPSIDMRIVLKKAIALAVAESVGCVSTDHLLKAILLTQPNPAADLLSRLNIPATHIINANPLFGAAGKNSGSCLTPWAVAAIEGAIDEALARGEGEVGTICLLMSLARIQDSSASSLLLSLVGLCDKPVE